jgi:hypothetical protein
LFGLLRSAGDVWCCVLELSSWRRRRKDVPLAAYQELCRKLAAAGPGTFGELDAVGARSVLRRYSDAWFATAKRRQAGDMSARYRGALVRGLRTAEPESTFPVSTRPGVTPDVGPHHGPRREGTWPAPARPDRQPAHREVAR